MDGTYPETYFCIDQKSFYASVECVERQLDPMTALLVVADAERSKNTICLAVSVGCKKKGIKNRCRLGDIPPNMNVIVAPPRMQLYIDCAAEIHGVFLKYFAPEDIYTYSIDESLFWPLLRLAPDRPGRYSSKCTEIPFVFLRFQIYAFSAIVSASQFDVPSPSECGDYCSFSLHHPF